MARMNLAIRGIAGQIEHGDSFHNDRHPDLRADYILANPPFNVSDWGGDRLRDDEAVGVRRSTAGQRQLRLGAALPVSPCSTRHCGFRPCKWLHVVEPVRRRRDSQKHHRGGLVDCIIALPGQLFRSTQIPACLWFLRRGRLNGEHRDRETLFIDARKLGHMLDRTRRDLSQEDIDLVADTYHAWRGGEKTNEYEDVPGFCKSATPVEIQKIGHVLTPGRYVGVAPQEDDGEPFEEKMARLATQWREQQAEAQRLDTEIEANLTRLGFRAGQTEP